jgi:RNA polymerase sigma factor (TIGR02999 family)
VLRRSACGSNKRKPIDLIAVCRLFSTRSDYPAIAVNPQPETQVTQLLQRWQEGSQQALEALMPLVYNELKRLAGSYLRRERPDHTLQSAALVNEAYLRLVGQTQTRWQNKAHFYGIAAQMMRRILADHARGHNAAKRGAGMPELELGEAMVQAQSRSVDVLDLEEALQKLEKLDAQQGRIVELRFYAGLSIEDTANVLGISPATVKRDWAAARAWLFLQVAARRPVES